MRLARRLPDERECEPEKSEDRYFYWLLHFGELRMPGECGGTNGNAVLEVLAFRGVLRYLAPIYWSRQGRRNPPSSIFERTGLMGRRPE